LKSTKHQRNPDTQKNITNGKLFILKSVEGRLEVFKERLLYYIISYIIRNNNNNREVWKSVSFLLTKLTLSTANALKIGKNTVKIGRNCHFYPQTDRVEAI